MQGANKLLRQKNIILEMKYFIHGIKALKLQPTDPSKDFSLTQRLARKAGSTISVKAIRLDPVTQSLPKRVISGK